jgi:hypothetical protein
MSNPSLHGLRIMEPVTAKALGFKSITNDIHPIEEKDIAKSIGQALTGTNSVWIRLSAHQIQAARLKSDLLS